MLSRSSIVIAGSTALSTTAIVQNLLSALDADQIDKAVEQFDEGFVLRDNALDLEFRDRDGLADFFRKRRGLFLEAHCYLQRPLIVDNTAVLRWTLEGFGLVGSYGGREYKSQVKTNGASVVECDHGKVKTWSDYYDSRSSMRTPLLTYFKEFDEF
jgi:hypothetical protein